uniref:Pentraxin family member n=1 Tax=Denticeps clupeoides TaxID=299321 RepID=A0AAY4DP89_9TELE
SLLLHLPKGQSYARINSYFPPLPAVTVCARIQWHQEHNHVSTIFSYAAPVLINEFQLRGQTKGEGRPVLLALIVQGHHQPYKASFPNDGEWHHVCVSWRSGDMLWVIHVDGERKDFGSVTGAQRNIHGDGIFIIGQDQDSFGGNFTEPFVGNLTDLNVWNEMLDDKQLWVLKVCQPLLNIETLFMTKLNVSSVFNHHPW